MAEVFSIVIFANTAFVNVSIEKDPCHGRITLKKAHILYLNTTTYVRDFIYCRKYDTHLIFNYLEESYSKNNIYVSST